MIGPSIAGILIAVSSEAFCFSGQRHQQIAVIVIVALMQIDVRAAKAASTTDAARAQEGVAYAAGPGADKVIAADRSAGGVSWRPPTRR